ncbi:MAG: hypothetical protein J5I91_06875 [Bacteroidetes bacterium]|nr:hypothetical protein [Bacteroidota bacterium]
MKKIIVLLTTFFLILTGCKVENLEDVFEKPKTNFSDFNYVISTEDASDVDITTFFTFNLSDINSDTKYDLIAENDLFINSNPSVSSGHLSMNQYFFALAKDKKGYSSTPGLYRMTLNDKNRVYINDNLSISKNNLFPSRQLCIVNETLGYFYDEGTDAQKIKIFNPSTMTLKGKIDLKPAIENFRQNIKWVDESGNNLVRTGSLVLDVKEDKLYVSIVFLEKAGFNLISNDEKNFYLAVININTNKVEKIIAYRGTKTVGFFVSENKSTTLGDDGNLYFCSWGWNQFNEGDPSQIFRIKAGTTDFDLNWKINIDEIFGPGRIAQSMAFYHGKLYLHVSTQPYSFADSDNPKAISMNYYVIDPNNPTQPTLLNIPESNTSERMNVFSIVDDQLFIAVPNIQTTKFNGFYSINSQGNITKEITIENKYRPTRLYKLMK